MALLKQPWKQVRPAEPAREYVGFTSRFFMKGLLRSLRFQLRAFKVMKQTEAAPGLIGWSLAADLPRLQFYTLSAWEDAQSLRAWIKDGAHGQATAEFADGTRRKSIFVYYPVRGADLPLRWDDAVRRQAQHDQARP